MVSQSNEKNKMLISFHNFRLILFIYNLYINLYVFILTYKVLMENYCITYFLKKLDNITIWPACADMYSHSYETTVLPTLTWCFCWFKITNRVETSIEFNFKYIYDRVGLLALNVQM